MNPQLPVLLMAIFLVLVMVLSVVTFLSRYVKVGPNQVLIVSGRKIQLPDGRYAGFRMVRGGGTFVFPIIEKADVLSLEITTIELPRSRAQTAAGRAVEVDGAAQVKIASDDASLVAAAELFLNKSPAEIKNIVQPVLEKHLLSALAGSSLEETMQNPAACAAKVQTSASTDLGKMGLSLISLTLRNARAS